MALWFLNFSTWDGVAGHLSWRTCSYGPGFAAAAWPVRCWRRWRPNAVDNGYTRLSWAVLNWNSDAIALYDGVGAQPQREWTTYRLSGPRAGRAGRTALIAAGGPAHGRGTEQQYQYGQRHDPQRDPEGRLMRAHREVPRDGQQQQLREHAPARVPSACRPIRAHPAASTAAADHGEPDRGAQPVDHALVGPGEPADHQHRGHHQRGRTLQATTINPAPRTADGAEGHVTASA